MIQLYKRGDTWHYSFMLNGRRIRRTSKRTKKSDAKEVALVHRQRLLNEIQLGTTEDISIGEGLERFLASREKPSAIAAAKYNIRKLLEGHEGGYRLDPDMPISSLRNEHLDRIKASRKRTGLSNSSINQELKCLQTMVNMARRKKWGVRLPNDLVFEMDKVQSKKRYLTADKERRLLEELDPMRVGTPGLAPIGERNEDLNQCLHDNYDLTVFLLDTGCRWGQATAVQWTVVDTKNWEHILIHRPKVSNFDTLALTDRLREILQRRYRDRRSVYDQDRVSPQRRGKRLQRRRHRTEAFRLQPADRGQGAVDRPAEPVEVTQGARQSVDGCTAICRYPNRFDVQ